MSQRLVKFIFVGRKEEKINIHDNLNGHLSTTAAGSTFGNLKLRFSKLKISAHEQKL